MRSLLLFLCGVALTAADASNYQYWSAAELKGYDQKLSDGKPVNLHQLGTFKEHSALVAHRESSGEAELHQHNADLMVIESGEATLLLGGHIVAGKATAAGEIRGKSIEGGSKQAVAPGDIIHIPAGTPHQVLLEPGRKITYFTMKVKGQ